MTVHAFVDESRRNSTYYVAAAIVAPAQLKHARKAMRSLLLPGQHEIHFHNEKAPRRRAIADYIARLPVEVRIYHRACDRNDERARQVCIGQLARHLLDRGAHRLVIDSRQDRDINDKRTLYSAMGKQQEEPLHHEHMPSTSDELLWVPDVVAWCYGTGGDWRTRIMPIVTAVCNVN